MLTKHDIDTLQDRFWEKVEMSGPLPRFAPELGPCWVWTASKSRSGYGVINRQCGDGKCRHYKAHRLAWFLHYGSWPEPHALHRCDNKACVRWDHLFEGGDVDNAKDYQLKKLLIGMAC